MLDPDRTPRTSLRADGVLAMGLAVLMLLGTYGASRNQPGPHQVFDAGAVVLVLLAAAALAFRRRYPIAVLGVELGIVFVYLSIGYVDGPIWLALVLANVTAMVYGHRAAAVSATLVGFALFPWIDSVLRDAPAPSFAALTALAAWLLVVLGTGEILRIRRERIVEAARIREQEALNRESEERLRIARELHDALGHHLSLINVQSGVALHLNEELPEQVRSSLTAIKESSKEALTELRSVLDILRREGERPPRSPTSTLDRLDDLVAQSREAGLDVHAVREGTARPLPFGVDVAAYRIVQEALTNVARHAGDTPATVRVSYADHDLVVQVDDEGRGGGAGATQGSGRGLTGMRERVGALGGAFEAGPRHDGGFRVKARLPLDGAS
jgi:signal transduction histidine kinase